jgi:hypothetical protein
MYNSNVGLLIKKHSNPLYSLIIGLYVYTNIIRRVGKLMYRIDKRLHMSNNKLLIHNISVQHGGGGGISGIVFAINKFTFSA